ncbi:MAG: transketolase [Candidatus Omnitrophica bacterium]|nr:transketolase [Candidatus Omnitrophota bacterium]
MKRPDIAVLKNEAKQIRRDILTMLSRAGSGHTGSSLSCVEILLSLYRYKLKYDANNPHWPQRDRFVLSKGHGCPALYAVLSACGFFSKEKLMTLRQLGSSLQGHPQIGLPGLEASTGSLGQGLSIANGMALSAKLDKNRTRVYCLLGDGEINEGQVWEAAMTASHYKLDNLCAIVDYNKLQIDGFLCDIKDMLSIKDKWSAFGWHTMQADGHDFSQIMQALDESETASGKPSIIIAHTTKGKGVSFIENRAQWHGVAPKPDELEKALKELA